MSLFLSESEKQGIQAARHDATVADFRWALERRVHQRVSKPGLLTGCETADWWRTVAEYVSDAAMAHALKPTSAKAAWLRDVTLSLVRRPVTDWVGPDYRDHTELDNGQHIGHLETSHLCWAGAAVLDLAVDVFSDAEREEVAAVLRERGASMCVNWLDRDHAAMNWWCVLASGLAVTAVVLDDAPLLERARKELAGCAELFQADGTYGESLQYGNYAIYSLMLASEALRRRGESVEEILPISRYVGYARWAAASYLYSRPTTGWGAAPKPRSLNFNDSGAVFRPTAEVLLHLATHGRESHPTEAGLARWLFEQTYRRYPLQGPNDQASFGLRTDWGFLTLPLLPQSASAISPAEAKLEPLQAFGCGDSIARDAWDGRTVLAMHAGGEDICSTGHLHHDMNTLMLVHNQERLLTDAGHSCYRNTLHQLEISTVMHNTCVFHQPDAPGIIEQHGIPRRRKQGDTLVPPVPRGATRLVAAQLDELRVMGSDAAASYGSPIERFARFVVLCGSHAIFVVDHIVSSRPVKAQWNWLLNNRDGELDLNMAGPDRVVARRGDAGMKLFSHVQQQPRKRWAHVNDAYHCLPGQMGEGRPGSAVLLHWMEPNAVTDRVGVHTMAVDTFGRIAGWHLRREEDWVGLESPAGETHWAVQAAADRILICEKTSGHQYELREAQDHWALTRHETI